MIHAGLLAVLIALAFDSLRRARRGGRRQAFVAVLVIAAALAESWLAIGEARLRANWNDLARRELGERSERIASFLRDRGGHALTDIANVGDDPDTKALLSGEPALAQAARRPVFLDLLERFPRRGPGGATVYDARGKPRAWSGWTPTATMSLARPPSGTTRIVEIRQGNIFTILEATSPIVDGESHVLGYVVYQEPLRATFPMHNRFLRSEDRLASLEGGSGVRADVALELAITGQHEIEGVAIATSKIDVRSEVASSTCSLLTSSGAPAGRISLSGLTRSGLAAEHLAHARALRAWLLLVTAVAFAARIWRRVSDRPWLRIVGIAVARVLLLRVSWPPGVDLLGIFDPSWFASIRFGGLLRSPGDLFLTAGAALLAGREVLRWLRRLEPALTRGGTRLWPITVPLSVLSALLVGSLLGLHWSRVSDVARNSNVPLFGGLDPFTSAPVAALEAGLLLLGAGFLAWGAALVSLSRALASRLPRGVVAGIIVAAALLASAVKMGDPSAVSASDFIRPLPALGALAAFLVLVGSKPRSATALILATSVLGAMTNFVPLRDGFSARRRELVELRALEYGESPSNARHFLLETSLESLAKSGELRDALEDRPALEHANLAFILWARSPLASANAGCHVRLLDAAGNAFSTFSLGFPPELVDRRSRRAEIVSAEVGFRREDVGSERVDVYSGRAPAMRESEAIGGVEVSLAYYDRLGQPRDLEDRFPSIFETEDPSEEFLRFTREVPDRVDRYRGEVLVASTDPEGGLGYRVPSVIVQTLAAAEGGGRWVERRIGGTLYSLYCVRERDGTDTVGYLTFGLERHGLADAASLFVRSLLVTLVLAAGLLGLLMLTPWLDAAPAARLGVPRFGFRGRVIAGFLFVSLLPTVFLGVAGRGLFVQEKRRQFHSRLEEDVRVSRELISRSLADAATHAASSAEVRAILRVPGAQGSLPSPPSVDGIVLTGVDGHLRARSPGVGNDLTNVAARVASTTTPIEFFERRGNALVACAAVPVGPGAADAQGTRGTVVAFRSVDAFLAAELERRVGSSVSFFADGVLAATSKPELYQSEVLSDLLDSAAYQKVELEGARRAVLESRFGKSSFLSNYAPLPDDRGRPVGVLATLAPFHGGGLDLDASLVLSRIYFLCLLVLAGALAAAVLLANRLTRPILDLTVGAERIGAGELGRRITTRAGGEIKALVRSFNLMSERLAVSEARDRERREFIEAIIRHVGSGVVSFDAQGRVATVNETAAGIVGRIPADLLGKQSRDGSLDENASLVLGAAEPLLAGAAEEVVREIEIAPADGGEPRSIRLVGTPLKDSSGSPQGAVLVFEDLTDLIRSKKITAWAEMARQVAHEIKNPLTPMKLSAQHLQQAWKDRHPKFDTILRESTDTIIDRCEALRRIAIEFSDYARMPGRKIQTEDLGRLLREARRLYGDTGERNVRFDVEAPEDSLFTRVDKDEVMRLFINLIENSIQAMPKGGNLSIRAWGENGSARVTVRDSGMGIPPENLGRIFEPSFSTKTGGAGLGLPICRAIIEDYGGSIAISSERGKGTTVELMFPSAPRLDPSSPRA